MIPLRLYMRNFMCYREQTLDFRGIHLACLSGSNGHGKSAILDAITWAIWGRSRVGARRDDELIYMGEVEMEVEFEFELQPSTPLNQISNGAVRYRALRKRSKQRRGQSSLELHGWDAAAAKFRSLTEPTIAQTQQRIIDLLHMDYDTFINSAFLLQGHADEFTIKRPAERKKVLSDILGLGMYDSYEKMAKDVAQEHKERSDQMLAIVDQIDRDLTREPDYRAAVAEAEAELAHLRQERTQTEASFEQIQKRQQQAQMAQQQLADLTRQVTVDRSEIKRLEDELSSHRGRLVVLESALAEQVEIERGFQAYQQAVADNEAMNAKLATSASLKEERSRLLQEIAEARHELDKARYAAAEYVQQIERQSDIGDQENEWQAAQATLAQLEARAAEREEAQAQIQDFSTAVAAMQADNKRAQEDANQIKEKIDLLSGVGGEAPAEAAHCPLCGQPLADSDCVHLRQTFEEQLQAERRAYRERNGQINEHLGRIKNLQETISEIDRELRQRAVWQRKEAGLAHIVEQARQAQQALPAAQDKLRALEAELTAEAFAPQAHAALEDIERQLGTLGYDAAAHRQIQAQMDRQRPFEARMQTLRDAQAGLETIHLAISQLEHNQAQVAQRLADMDRQIGDLRQVADQLPELQRQVLQARHVLERAHDREQEASLRLGAARNKVEFCADLKRQRAKRLEEEKTLREEQGIYQELQRAFGKNGVQAMLIETAIPDIEREANLLLARLTAGQMQVRFETQRDTRAGDTIETLDIHITDQLGTRSYETYSGGERYRIDFAIRIALSKLLARRAGAQLQMLVIDEGFGTQDNEGRESVVDAINAIRDDFQCILAITHIDELKDAFNVRIEVVKTAHGSEITVM